MTTAVTRRHPDARRRPDVFVCGALLGVVLLVMGCSNAARPEVPVVPTPAGTDATAASGSTAPTPSPSSTVGVPFLCEELASAGDIARIIQVPMQGETRRVYNDDFLADSGRTGRLTCSYGVPVGTPGASAPPTPPTPAPPPLTVAVSGYVDADTAAGRIEGTVDAAQAGGGRVSAQPVGGRDGFLLDDPEDVSLVFADEGRTYVLTLRHGVVPTAAEKVVLVELATHMLTGE